MIAKSKEKKQLQLLVEENENYQEQVKALQKLLRTNAEDLEKYKRLVQVYSASSSSMHPTGGSWMPTLTWGGCVACHRSHRAMAPVAGQEVRRKRKAHPQRKCKVCKAQPSPTWCRFFGR